MLVPVKGSPPSRTAYRPKSGKILWSFVPTIVIVGLPDAAVQESRERVQAAIKNDSLYYPRKRLTVNLTLADVLFSGISFQDLG
jgi:predicted ATPase with chaperone activity